MPIAKQIAIAFTAHHMDLYHVLVPLLLTLLFVSISASAATGFLSVWAVARAAGRLVRHV